MAPEEPANSRDDGLNIHNLSLAPDQLPKPIEQEPAIHPIVSPAYEDVPMWNILPSYQLFQSTFSQSIQPSYDDPRFDPPTYDMASPAASLDGTHAEYFLGVAPTPASSTYAQPTLWENTILGNTHRLKKLLEISTCSANRVKMKVTLTDRPCVRGVPPLVIEPLEYEFQQGDYVHGYVTVFNESDDPLPFDMFSVVLEGKISVLGDHTDLKRPLVFYKFLNMYDFHSSWTPTNISKPLESEWFDPLDECWLAFPDKKVLTPRAKYKKYFTFRLPDRLLDCTCEPHSLANHCEALPTIGLERDEFLKKLRTFRAHNNTRPNSASFSVGSAPNTPKRKGVEGVLSKRIKDLCFPDTAISYSVEARVVAKASDYRIPDIATDELIIVNEANEFFRVIPRDLISQRIDPDDLKREAIIIHENLVSRVKEKLELGAELVLTNVTPLQLPSEQVPVSRSNSLVKQKQLYFPSGPHRKTYELYVKSTHYELYVPFKKKSLGAPPKVLGLVGIKTPKVDYAVKYIPPYNFKRFHVYPSKATTVVKIPLELTFSSASNQKTKPPEIRLVSVELVATTYRSKKYSIPIEIFNDLKFRNTSVDNDNLETYVVAPFKKYLAQLTGITSRIGAEVLNVDAQFIMDIKALANLLVKYNSLKVEKTKATASNGFVTWDEPVVSAQNATYTKTIDVVVDINHALTREASNDDLAGEAFALVPSFQSCIIGRYYYLKINVKLQNQDVVPIKVPVTIEA